MTVQAFFRIQCSGGCGRWLADAIDDRVMMTSARSNALVFTSREDAEKFSADLGMRTGDDDLCPRCRAQS